MALQNPQQFVKSDQKITQSGRIYLPKKGWIIRGLVILGLIGIIIYNLYVGLYLVDPLVAYSTIMPLHALLVLIVGWFFYKNPATGIDREELVSVLIPVFNQESMIDTVIKAIFESTHRNLQVIAVNDGSTDKSKQILDMLSKKYPLLKVIHRKNQGKRHAIATGFAKSSGKYIVLIDSDSVVDKNAISEFMKTFDAHPKVGSLVGYAKVWNSKKNILTKCQDAWYDYAFNIHKTTESRLGNVLCCSGCLAGYRREAIEYFIPHWIKTKIHNSDDRDLTTYVIAQDWMKKELAPFSQKLLEAGCNYDDAEDRMLTAQTLTEWNSVYVSTAVVYTDVPEKIHGYIRQQTRWKKGFIRSNFFVSTFFWKKNPIISSIFYTEFMVTFTAPLIVLIILFYEPFILKNYWVPLAFISGSFLTGFAHGLDYKMRDPSSKYWKYKPLMNFFTSFGLSWLVIPALLTFRKNQWLTR
ncbi:MAG TPA: glycosyltransferase [Nitrosopumilaceae archaeon]|nr:glycosyltransferase [Nitrosopumilaceae archaeon]